MTSRPNSRASLAVIKEPDLRLASTTSTAELKAAIKKAVLEVATKDPDTFQKIYEGKLKPYQAIDHKAYEPVIELIKFVDDLRKKKAGS